jgi:hypothetical protein
MNAQLLPIIFCCVFLYQITEGTTIAQADEPQDIRSVAADLVIPEIIDGPPKAGCRVKQTCQGWPPASVYHVLYLPQNWRDDGTKYPILIEWNGNGGYANSIGDVCDGRPESSKLGYGLSAGQDFIWVSLPYINETSDDLALTWWGNAPTYDPQPTLRYCHEAIDHVCRLYGGDPDRVVLSGFSRGAIACNYLGLHDDRTASLWCGFFVFSHYDGMRPWPFPNSDAESACVRLKRLGDRPQFICSESNGSDAVRGYLEPLISQDRIVYANTGFRNHNDAWILRPSQTRIAARDWLRQLCGNHRD